MTTCTCWPDRLDLGCYTQGCPVHDPGARAEATAARIAAEARANVAAGRGARWDEGEEARIAAAADKAETDRLFAEAGL